MPANDDPVAAQDHRPIQVIGSGSEDKCSASLGGDGLRPALDRLTVVAAVVRRATELFDPSPIRYVRNPDLAPVCTRELHADGPLVPASSPKPYLRQDWAIVDRGLGTYYAEGTQDAMPWEGVDAVPRVLFIWIAFAAAQGVVRMEVSALSGDVIAADGDGLVVVLRRHAEEVARCARGVLAGDKAGRRRLYEQLGMPLDDSVR